MALSPSPGPTVDDESTPTERFIYEMVEPQKDQMNRWREVLSMRGALILDAKKRRKFTPTKLAPANVVPAYALTRSGQMVGGIDGRYTTLVSHQARKATQSRLTLKQYLQASELPTLPGRFFHVSRKSGAAAYALPQNLPVVVKPAVRRAKRGTTVAVTEAEQFDRAWDAAAKATGVLNVLDQQVLIEPYRPGLLLRLYVVGEDAVGAVVRVPLYVTGDGQSTVEELLVNELSGRDQCTFLKDRHPAVDKSFLQRAGIPAGDVPASGSVLVLSSTPDVEHDGGLSVDVLNQVGSPLVELGINTLWAFPGLASTAVDILTPNLESADEAVILDVDPGADFREFMYPAYGESRRVSLAILDQMLIKAKR